MPMIETLHRTNVPEEMMRAEYYQPRMEMKFHQEKWVFVVSETHGWYDGQQKEAVQKITTLNPEATEGFATIGEAWERYREQVSRRVSDGFVHSFYIEFDGNTLAPVNHYRQLRDALDVLISDLRPRRGSLAVGFRFLFAIW
jgi:hypothetical protein